MKRVIRFQRTRYIFFAISASIFITGGAFYLFRGFNLGVDFKAGIAMQFQIAPASFALQYTGPGKAEVSVPSGEQALTATGDVIVSVTDPQTGIKQPSPFHYRDYKTVKDLVDAIASKIPGITVQPKGDMSMPPSQIIPPVSVADISGKPYTFNVQPRPITGQRVGIADVRAALAPMGQLDLQVAGRPSDQEFIARVEAKSEDPNFQISTQNRAQELLGEKFGADSVLMKSTDFVGPRLSQALARQSIWLVLIAVVLILIYMMFRFKPIYAVAAVLALVHDALVMLTYNSVFHIEMDAGTIAAILTILGYSINDTIVIFDRVRENSNLMRGAGLETMLDTSVSQTLGRTFITSGATLLTVLSLFLLTTGSMKIFSLNMLVGIVEGSYSTVFIASPIVLEWENWRERRRKKLEQEKYGMKPAAAKEEELEAEEVEAEAEEAPVELASATSRTAPQEAPAGAVEAGSDGGQTAEAEPTAQDGQQAQAPQEKILSFPGGQKQAYRHHHKRHKGRHHH